MKDIHETNLPAEESGKLDETNAPDVMPENAAEETTAVETPEVAEPPVEVETPTEAEAPAEVEAPTEAEAPAEAEAETPEAADTPAEENHVSNHNSKLTKDEIIAKLTELLDAPIEDVRGEIESLKQAFYKIHRAEVEELKKEFIENGNDEKDFLAPTDELETKLKDILAAFKEKKAAMHAREEEQKAANYALKLQLIDRLKELTESQEDFNKLYNEFKDIQLRWKEIKLVPQEHANELWRNYQVYSERFYDIIKINNQFRDYDFKKNLELKTVLCEAVEKLENEQDVISAFHQLQKLHQQWREIGPVAKEVREEIWSRFKAASTTINKRHQTHFEELKAKEQGNLEAKIAICEKIEAVDYSLLTTYKLWEEKSKEVLDLQEQWKKIGFAPRKHNVKVFERFREACDIYFKNKGVFFKAIKEEMEANLQKKVALCEKAEALKESTDWKDTTEKMIALQKEWKTIGSVSRRHSDTVWKRFISACDYFFEQKNKNTSSQKGTEQANLVVKKELIQKINSMDESQPHDEALAALKDHMAEWNSIGFVPFKEKDKIYKEYHEAVDKQFDRLKVDQSDRKMQSFRSNLSDMASGERGKGKIYGERDRLMRNYDRLKNELQTYENNIGFLSVSSKGGGGLVKEMERKIVKLKEEMELIIKKIDAIDETLE